jgi:ABC-type phosphate transport system substrate-binding protein
MGKRRLLIVLLAATLAGGPASAKDLVVIVHPDRDQKLSRSEVAQIFLKRRRFWQNGDAIVPVNRDSISPERESFVRRIFGDEGRRLEIYWNRQYFQGVLPPATLASDEAVKRFVSSEPLAIGYISPDRVDASVRVVLRIGD